jgi:hypothetical protein
LIEAVVPTVVRHDVFTKDPCRHHGRLRCGRALSPPAPAGPISAGIAGARVRPSAVLLTASGGPVRRKVRAP